MTPIPAAVGADVVGMKPTAKPAPFNPSLGLAIKGMWSVTFTKAIVEAITLADHPEPTSKPKAA